MNIAIIGTGYVGIVTAAVLAKLNHNIYGLDIDLKRIELLKKGISPIYEPGLEDLIKKGIKSQKLKFTTSYKEALEKAQIIFICVGTPQNEKGEIELNYINSAIESIAKNLQNETIIVLKSTVPPGIQNDLAKIFDKFTKKKYQFASIPEFLREGTAVSDTLNPDRIVIGSDNKKVEKILLDLHKDLPGKRICTDIISAQMIKYTANSFLATKISFANSIAKICDLLGADVDQVMEGVGTDHRIANSFFKTGLGYGGSCFPKDVSGLQFLAQKSGYQFDLLKQVEKVNNDQINFFIEKTQKQVRSFKNKKIAVLGLAFKAETDDIRESRSILLINSLLEKGAKISTYDPIASKNAKKVLPEKVAFCDNLEKTVKDSEVIFIATDWQEFKDMDLRKIKKMMKGNIFVDGRNIFSPEKLTKLGFNYISVGRK